MSGLPFPSDGPDPLIVGAAWADDVAHELAGPVAFLGEFIGRVERGVIPDDEHVSIAAEEVGRLHSLLGYLHRVRARAGALRPQSLRELLHVAAEASECRHAIEVPPDVRIMVDDSYVPHGLVPLLRACGGAVGPAGELRITLRAEKSERGPVTLEIVLHADPSVVRDGKVLFVGHMWRSAVAGRVSTDVVLAKRILRAHGHRVWDETNGPTHTLTLLIPPS